MTDADTFDELDDIVTRLGDLETEFNDKAGKGASDYYAEACADLGELVLKYRRLQAHYEDADTERRATEARRDRQAWEGRVL